MDYPGFGQVPVKSPGILRFTLCQWALLARCCILIILVRRRLRTSGVKAFASWIVDGEQAAGPAGKEIMETATGLAYLVNKAAFHFPADVSCLERSLVLVQLLRRRGIPGVVRIGAEALEKGADFSAHAWVELHGRVINDDSSRVAAMEQFRRRRRPP